MPENYPKKYWWIVLILVPIVVALVQVLPDLVSKDEPKVEHPTSRDEEALSNHAVRKEPEQSQRVQGDKELKRETQVVVLMDSTLPSLVYDEKSRQEGRTNADDITDILEGLPLRLIKETTSLDWRREEQVVQLEPDLIVIHRSCFYDQTKPYTDDSRKFDSFLEYVGKTSPATRFLVYSRAFTSEQFRQQWIANVENKLPMLQGRITTFHVEGGANASFKNVATGRAIKLRVRSILGLG